MGANYGWVRYGLVDVIVMLPHNNNTTNYSCIQHRI